MRIRVHTTRRLEVIQRHGNGTYAGTETVVLRKFELLAVNENEDSLLAWLAAQAKDNNVHPGDTNHIAIYVEK
jgi:hypothetical protein